MKIENIGTLTRNNWIIETDIGIIAIDTGLPGQCGGFLQRFKNKWKIENLKYIFLTHAHNDHCGFLCDLLDKINVQVILDEKSIPILASGKSGENHEYKNWLGYILGQTTKSPFGGFPKITDASRFIIVKEGSSFFKNMGLSFEIIALPGHTRDSIGLYLPDDNIIICGDAAMNTIFNSNRRTVLIENISDFNRSWNKIIKINPKLIYPGHGKPFHTKDLIKYLDLK